MSKSTGNGKAQLANAIRRIKRAESGPDRLGVDIRYRVEDPNTGAADVRLVIIRAVVNRCKGKVFGGAARSTIIQGKGEGNAVSHTDMGDRFGENAGFAHPKKGEDPSTLFGRDADPLGRNKVRTRNKAVGWKGGHTGGAWGAIIGTRKGGGFFGVNLRADISPEDIVQMIVADRMTPRICIGTPDGINSDGSTRYKEKFTLYSDGIPTILPETPKDGYVRVYPNGFWDKPTDTGKLDPKTGRNVLELGNLLRGWKTAVVMGVRGWYGEVSESGSDANNLRRGMFGSTHNKGNLRFGRGPINPNKGTTDPDIGEAADILLKLGGKLNGVCLDILAEMTNGDESPVSEKVQTLAERHRIGVATVYRHLSGIRERAGKLIGK